MRYQLKVPQNRNKNNDGDADEDNNRPIQRSVARTNRRWMNFFQYLGWKVLCKFQLFLFYYFSLKTAKGKKNPGGWIRARIEGGKRK